MEKVGKIPIDYRKLLVKYMDHVAGCEGIYFTGRYLDTNDSFTEEEKAQIEDYWMNDDPEDPDGRYSAAWLYDYSDWEIEDDYVEIYGPFTVDIIDEDEYNVVIEENIKLENRPKIDPNSPWPFK